MNHGVIRIDTPGSKVGQGLQSGAVPKQGLFGALGPQSRSPRVISAPAPRGKSWGRDVLQVSLGFRGASMPSSLHYLRNGRYPVP